MSRGHPVAVAYELLYIKKSFHKVITFNDGIQWRKVTLVSLVAIMRA